MKNSQRKSKSIMRLVAVCMILVLASIFTACSAAKGEDKTLQDTMAPGDVNPSDYIALGDYEGFEVRVDGLDVYVGEVLVNVPYRDEAFGTEYTLQYYYSQVNPAEDRTNWVIPTDEDVVQMGVPGVASYSDLKDYVSQKINENDEITSFMIIGDAVMEQVVANSTFKKIPEDVLLTCKGIYTDYLEEMLSRYNEIGEIPAVQKDENSAYKVLAAMAIAKETGIDMNAFDYEKVLKYLVQ